MECRQPFWLLENPEKHPDYDGNHSQDPTEIEEFQCNAQNGLYHSDKDHHRENDADDVKKSHEKPS